MAVPFIDLRAQYESIKEDVRAAIDRVLSTQSFILGPEVEAFEQEIAQFLGVSHAVGVSSGTDALLAALMFAGVGPGDEVITTPFTFLATTMVIARLGARAVFVDVEPDGVLMDSSNVARAITSKTRAIVPVHLFGEMVDMHGLLRVAGTVMVIEDAAQAIGATRDGLSAGATGNLGCLSFFPTKNLGAYGDAGMVVTTDDAIAAEIKAIRAQGQSRKHVALRLGGNFRLDALQAAVLRVKLSRLHEWTHARCLRARAYRGLLGPLDALALPPDREGHVWHQFVVRTPRRDALRAFLAERGIASEVYYPLPMHLEPAFASWSYERGAFPHAERAASEALSLPIYPELTLDMQREVAGAIALFFRSK